MNALPITRACDITWRTDSMAPDLIDAIIGSGTVAAFLRLAPNEALCLASGRAAGYWDANERELHAAYRSIERILREVTP